MRQVNIAKLTQLTHNRETSIRLYYAYRGKYEGKSPEWIVEKCIEDLLRDRGVEVRNSKGPRAYGFPKIKQIPIKSASPSDITKWAALAALIAISIFITLNRHSTTQPGVQTDPRISAPEVGQ